MDSRAFHEALADHAIQFRASVERDNMVVSVVTLTRESAPGDAVCCRLALTHPRFDAEAVTRVRAQMIQSIQEGESRAAHRGAARLFQGLLQRPSLWPSQRWRGRQHLSAITAEDLRGFAKKPLGQGRSEDRRGRRHHGAGGARNFWPTPSSPCPAPRRRRCPISGGWAIRACMCCRCRCRSPPCCSACRASCAPIRISFPAMSPITFWAAADFPRA